jgi:hypothetical protein
MNAERGGVFEAHQLEGATSATLAGLSAEDGQAGRVALVRYSRKAFAGMVQDPDYREFLRVTSRFKLAPEVAVQLYSYKQPVAEECTRVEADPTLTPQQKAAAFQAIADETQRAVKETLGDQAFRYFIRCTANSWVRGHSAATGVVAAPPP